MVAGLNGPMGVQQNWLANLRHLVDAHSRGDDKRGGFRYVAASAGLSEEYVYQLYEGKPAADGSTRNMGPRAAKAIARAFADGRPLDWIDQPPDPGIKFSLAEVGSPYEPTEVEIARFDTGGAMGDGLVLKDQPGVIQSWRVSPEWIQKNVRHYSAVKNLCIVTGFGDSMRPMFNPGDPLLVDVGVRVVEFDAVYFFRVDGEGFIKRLQRIPGEGIRVLSANRDSYEPWTIKKGMDFEVFGRVLKVWCSEDL